MMTRANQSVVIHLDSESPGALRIRTIPPLSELQALREQGLGSLTQAELYALAALAGVQDLRNKLGAGEGA
jgi:hypothetical protein